ncbi:MAG: hypothetical protein AAF203_01580, partial [Pseudomonadota bacterium]
LAWITRFGDLTDQQRITLRKKVIKQISKKIEKDKLLKNEPASLKNDFEILYILEENDNPKKSQKALLNYYDYLKSRGRRRKSHLIYLAHMLSFDEDSVPESLNVYDDLLSRAPHLVSIKIRKARVLVQQKQYEKALKILKSSLPDSYGDNQFHAYWLLHLAYDGLKQKKKSKDILQEGYWLGKKKYGENANLFSKYKKIKEKYEEAKL